MSSSGRPRSTRDAILAATTDLLIERGARVTLEEIAERARVSRQALYLHFGSRTGLMIAAAEHIDQQGALGRLLDDVFEAPTGLDALDAIVVLHATYYPVIHQIAAMFMAGKYEDDALRAAWDDRMESRHRLYHEVVQRLHRENVLAPEWDVETATDILWSITSWELWELLARERGWSEADYVSRLKAVLRRLLCESDTDPR